MIPCIAHERGDISSVEFVQNVRDCHQIECVGSQQPNDASVTPLCAPNRIQPCGCGEPLPYCDPLGNILDSHNAKQFGEMLTSRPHCRSGACSQIQHAFHVQIGNSFLHLSQHLRDCGVCCGHAANQIGSLVEAIEL